MTDNPENPELPRAQTESAAVQMIGLDQDLANDVLGKLKKLPHDEVDSVLRRLAAAPVINVTRQN